MRRDFGDYQTPPALVAAVLDALGQIGERWPRVLEPTCGRGHFLAGLIGLATPPREIQGIEIQAVHLDQARALARGAGPVRVDFTRASLFDVDLRRDLHWGRRGPLLVVGNPPWVTNAELGLLASGNLPRKRNVRGLRGIDARTGASNFDLAEAVWLKLLDELAAEEPTIALLCKRSVARNVLAFAERAELPVAAASIHRVDAQKWFRAAVDACLLRVTLGARREERAGRVPVFPDLRAREPESVLGFVRGRLIADLGAYEARAFADGICPLTWRQGVKHDAAPIMELARTSGSEPWRNKLGEVVDVEPDWIFPLLKGADLAGSSPVATRRGVIVTQRRIGQDTRALECQAPRLWGYLMRHAAAFARRKSSIYRDRPPFALFGVGPYSFARFKVAVSGLHKAPRFHAVGPVAGRPVLLDDTSYFLACDTAEQAALVAALWNDPIALDLLRALTFRDAKRPITKRVLQRVDLKAVAGRADRAALLARAEADRERLAGAPARPAFPWPEALESMLGASSRIGR